MIKFRAPVVALSVCLFAGGCTDSDWNRMLNYGGMGSDEAAAPATPAEVQAVAAPAAPAEPSNADFCKGVAAQDATRNGFDPATQQRVFARSYSQCVAIYTR